MNALDGFDAALEHRVRLTIAVLLARHGEISFSRFKELLELTDGNLGAQFRRLAARRGATCSSRTRNCEDASTM